MRRERNTTCPDSARYDRGQCAWPRCKCPDGPQPEKADTVHVAWQLFNTCQEVERIRMVIEAYAKAGISGTVHDLEHHDMLTDALARRAALFGDLRIRIRS